MVMGGVALGNNLAFLHFGGEVYHLVVVYVDLAILNLAVGVSINPRSLILAYTQSEDIRPMLGAFRGLDRT